MMATLRRRGFATEDISSVYRTDHVSPRRTQNTQRKQGYYLRPMFTRSGYGIADLLACGSRLPLEGVVMRDMDRSIFRRGLGVCCAILVAAAAAAQAPVGTISGILRDQSEAVLPHA